MDQEDASIIEKVLISKISKKYTYKKLFAFWMYVPKRNGYVAQPLLQTFRRVFCRENVCFEACHLQAASLLQFKKISNEKCQGITVPVSNIESDTRE